MPSIAVDVMSGDSGAPECIPGALRALATDPALELILVGDPAVIEPALAACAGGGARARVRASRGHRGGHVRASARGDPPAQGFLDAHRHRPREGGPCGRHGQRRQHRRAHGHGALRAEDRGPRGTRAHHVVGARAQRRPHAHPRSRREHQGDGAAARAVRHHGLDRRARRVRHRQRRASACSTSARKTPRATSSSRKRTS